MRACILFLIGTFLVQHSLAVSCESYKSQSSCQAVSGCAWDGSNGPCICGTADQQDICFLIDESGSVGRTQFNRGVDFIRNTVKALSRLSRVSLVEFASSTRTVYELTRPQFSNSNKWNYVITNGVNRLSYSGGATYTRKGAYACLDTFKRGGRLTNSAVQKKMILQTDGFPWGCVNYYSGGWKHCCGCTVALQFMSPCGPYKINGKTTAETFVKQYGIQTFVVAIGKHFAKDKSSFTCLTGHQNVIQIDNYDANTLNSVTPQTQAFLCPRAVKLRVSEVKIGTTRTNKRYNPVYRPGALSRFVELYNMESSWDLFDHQLQIELEHNDRVFATCYTPKIRKTIAKGSYIVIYDPSREMPQCHNCACPKSNNRCTNAYYVPCQSSSGSMRGWGGNKNPRKFEVEVYENNNNAKEEIAECETEYMKSPKNGESHCEIRASTDTECQPSNFALACQSSGNPGAGNMGTCPPPPTPQPTKRPTLRPTTFPTPRPTKFPTKRPTLRPTKFPTKRPTPKPTKRPTLRPTRDPTFKPTKTPSKFPTAKPTKGPSNFPSRTPTKSPSKDPTAQPSKDPSKAPSKGPSQSPTKSPSKTPSRTPTKGPSASPTKMPSAGPSSSPSQTPSQSPSKNPSATPTGSPSMSPSKNPSSTPTKPPSNNPTATPTAGPSKSPATSSPSGSPTKFPSVTSPTADPTTSGPSRSPTKPPSVTPTGSPSLSPSTQPSKSPSSSPSSSPSVSPTKMPSKSPTDNPSKSPSSSPSVSPTKDPSASPSSSPSASPSGSPSKSPSASPTKGPTTGPSASPSKSPSKMPSGSPTKGPTKSPSLSPTVSPTENPSSSPSASPTKSPSVSPTKSPTQLPSSTPTRTPSASPTKDPSLSPTLSPSSNPSMAPTLSPTRCGDLECQWDGDTGATCNAVGNCACTTASFYPSADQLQCFPKTAVPPPFSCLVSNTGLSITVTASNQTVGLSYSYRCKLQPGGAQFDSSQSTLVGLNQNCNEGSCTASCVALSLNPSDTTILPESISVPCTFEPVGTTTTTTPAPSSSHPMMYGCSATMNGGSSSSVTVEFQAAPDPRITEIQVATTSGSTCSTLSADLLTSTTVGTITLSTGELVRRTSVTIAATTSTKICVGALTALQTSITQVPFVDRSTADVTEATILPCTIQTLNPTAGPTKSPTNLPSTTPTEGPSGSPTMRPTFGPPIIVCTCTLAGTNTIRVSGTIGGVEAITLLRVVGSANGQQTINYNLPPAANLQETVVLSAGETFPTQCTLVANYPEFPGGPPRPAVSQVCTLQSANPTATPTQTPSGAPTTPDPTATPTQTPSRAPTASPTSTISIPDCTITFPAGNSGFVVAFAGPVVISPASDTNKVSMTIEAALAGQTTQTFSLINTQAINQQASSGSYTQTFRSNQVQGVTAEYGFVLKASGLGNPVGALQKACAKTTSDPTMAPTLSPSLSPTSSPTYQQVIVSLFDNTFCSDAARVICPCGVQSCSGGFDFRTVSGLEVQESRAPKTLTIARSPNLPSFPFAVTINFVITTNPQDFAVGQDVAPVLPIPANETDLEPVTPNGAPVWGPQTVTVGALSASSQAQFDYVVVREAFQPSEQPEQYYVAITGCTYDDGTGRACIVGYPRIFRYTILDNPLRDTLTLTSTAVIPEYAWFIIAIGVLLVASLVFMAYRKYKKANTQLAHVQSIEEEIEQLDYEDDPMELNAKHAFMNPLATGVKGNEWGTVDKYLDAERAEARKNIELAQVNVEEGVLRQEFAAARPVDRQFSDSTAFGRTGTDTYDQIQSTSTMSVAATNGASTNNLSEALSSSYADPSFNGDMI